MAYQAVYLVEHGYRDDPFRFINADENGLIVVEPWDGPQIRRYWAEGIHLYRRPRGEEDAREILFYEQTPVEFWVSDSRVMLRIERHEASYHKDETFAAVLRGGVNKIPAYRRGEMVLMGMIRYEWISQIACVETGRRFSRREALRLYYQDQNQYTWYLDVVFGADADAEYLANEILHRACRYRLQMTDDKDDKEMVFFNHYLKEDGVEAAPEGYGLTVRFPTQYAAPGGENDRPSLMI